VIEISDGDYQPMNAFPLRWRWHDPERARTQQQLPPETVAAIKPLSIRKAQEVWHKCRLFAHGDSLAPERFDSILQFFAQSASTSQVRSWLSNLGISPDVKVVVSWGREWAVTVSFGLFCELWDTFCYPGSDDVIIHPMSQEWAIFFHHEEVLFFGRIRQH
jgi:hypothetical protein